MRNDLPFNVHRCLWRQASEARATAPQLTSAKKESAGENECTHGRKADDCVTTATAWGECTGTYKLAEYMHKEKNLIIALVWLKNEH